MADETLAAAEVARLSRAEFVNVKVDIAARPDLFRDKIGGRGGLATCIVDAEGDVVSALPGFAAAPAYLAFLKRAAEGYARLKAAREAAREAARSAPEDPAALLDWAETYLALESFRRAEEVYERIVGMGTATAGQRRCAAVSRERLARACAGRGRNLDARVHLEEYRKLDPENALGRGDRIALTEAMILSIERRVTDAVRVLEEALRRFPQSEERLPMLLVEAVCRHESGENQRAMEMLEELAREHAGTVWGTRARERIAQLQSGGHKH
jgi:tetratricopeptide (TPR) repeat protein